MIEFMDKYWLLAAMSVLAYVLGSIPFGLVLAKTFCGIDPRLDGSRNVGATNVARLCGKKWGFATLVCDLGKGALVVGLGFLALRQYPQAPAYLPAVAGLVVIMGHMYSFFLRFKGGKGVATTVGVFLALTPAPFLIAVVICLLIIWRSGYVSAGSIAFVLTLPPLAYYFGYRPEFALALAVCVLVLVAHRENIVRLCKGQEKPWNVAKKPDDKAT